MRSYTRLVLPLLLASLCTAQPNILNNGGFETGLMCYNFYIWNNDIFGPSDYKVLLSNDSHSGNHSIELRCGGTDCQKAGVYSNNIPAVPNQSYTLSVWAKCPGGTNALAAMFIPGTANGDIGSIMTCNGTWTPNQVTFTMGPSTQDFFFYIFHYDFGAGPQSLLVDDVVLTYADGTAPAQVVLHPGIRNSSIVGNTVQVDGAPYLALGFFGLSAQDLTQAAALGANTAVGLGDNNPATNCFNTGPKSFLDQVYEAGLNFVPDSTSNARLNAPAVFPATMQTFAPHLANIAWMLADEPDETYATWWEIPGPTFVSEYNAAKTQTTLPILSDMQRAATGDPSEVSAYVSGVDLWMAEPYGPDFKYVNHATGLLTGLRPLPIWLAQDNPDPAVIVPKAYWDIANGATGIIFFTWGAYKADAAKLAAAQQVFSELTQLKTVLFSQNINSLVSPPSGIAFQARYSGGAAYILAANSVSQTVPAQFLIQGLPAGIQVQVLFENRTITSNAGSFTDTFAGISRHVYSLNAPLVALSGSLGAKTGLDSARDWKAQVYNSGIATANSASISNMTFTLTGGKSCTPVLVSSLPIGLGDIAAGSSTTGDAIINFTGCDTTSKFTVNIAFSANGGSASGTLLRNNERK